MHEAQHILALVLIAALGIGAQWLAWRLRWPAIVLLVVFGVVAGPVMGWVVPSRDLGPLLTPVIKLCVAVILFEGGLTLRLHELREARGGVRRLVFSALPLSWILGSLAARYIGGLEWPVALLFGAIITVTGPTVILPLLRQAGLRKRPASYLKWEAIINDPLGALLAVLVFQYLTVPGTITGARLALQLSLAALVAAAAGWAAARAIALVFTRGWAPEYLKPPILLATVFLVYAAANLIHAEAGLLSSTVMGLTLANLKLADIEELRRFKEYLTVLLVSVVFILITSNLSADTLLHLDWRAAALIAAVVFLVRPAAIWLGTLGSEMTLRERALVGWIAPRGIVAAAVAGVFGPGLHAAGYEDAELLAPLIFALIMTTVILHGFSLGWVARRLGLAAKERRGLMIVGANPWSLELARVLNDAGGRTLLVDANWQHLRPARLSGLKQFYGEILSESAEERMDVSDLGYLLAATDNDAYNTLVCSRFVPVFGRERVYQLPAGQEEDPKQVHHTLRGRVFYGQAARYEALLERYYLGWRFLKTPITPAFTAADYFAWVGEEAMPVVLIRSGGGLVFRQPDTTLRPEPGDTMVTFVSPTMLRDRPVGGRGLPTAE